MRHAHLGASVHFQLKNCLFIHCKQCTLLINTINSFALMNVSVRGDVRAAENIEKQQQQQKTRSFFFVVLVASIHSIRNFFFCAHQSVNQRGLWMHTILCAICANNYWGHKQFSVLIKRTESVFRTNWSQRKYDMFFEYAPRASSTHTCFIFKMHFNLI